MTTNIPKESELSPPILPNGYKDFLEEIKGRIREAQIRASLSVNKELVVLYWSIGKSILDKQAVEGWGAKIIERMARDLTSDFPGVSGFSVRNLKYMRKFAEVYPDSQIVQALLAQLPWWHNMLLLEKLKDPLVREWYAQEVIKNGWSGRALEEAIRSNLYDRKGLKLGGLVYVFTISPFYKGHEEILFEYEKKKKKEFDSLVGVLLVKKWMCVKYTTLLYAPLVFYIWK